VRSMVRNLGGDIALRSELDQGTTMTINLPRDLRHSPAGKRTETEMGVA